MQVDVFDSINADRRPDLRAATIARSFQRETCATCDASFRVDPDFNYLDIGRGQWIAVHPFEALERWREVEAADMAAFDRAYGAEASAGARALAVGMTVRVTFGWAAFREKLVAAEHGLDDITLELLKIAMVRNLDDVPLSDVDELRLIDVAGGALTLARLDATTDTVAESLELPRAAYEEIELEAAGWQPLRDALTAGPFADMNRLTLP